jgi:hypothetical protein
MKIEKELAERIVYEDAEGWKMISETIEDQRRWVTVFSGLFLHEPSGKVYEVSYEKGSTECQDSTELFYEDFVEFAEMEEREVTIKQWVPVAS